MESYYALPGIDGQSDATHGTRKLKAVGIIFAVMFVFGGVCFWRSSVEGMQAALQTPQTSWKTNSLLAYRMFTLGVMQVDNLNTLKGFSTHSGGDHEDFDALEGADAGDESWANGACSIYAATNFLSAVLKSVHQLDLDATDSTLILINEHDELNPATPATIFGCQSPVPDLVSSYIAKGGVFPLLDGGSVTFVMNEKEAMESTPGLGMKVSQLTPGDILGVQMTPAEWEDHYGKVEEFPGLATDKWRVHAVMFTGEDENGTICVRNSWKGMKYMTVPTEGVFERVVSKTTYTLSQVEEQ